MTDSSQILPPPPVRQPVMGTDGILSSAWWLWFTQLFNRTGGAVAANNSDLDILDAYGEGISTNFPALAKNTNTLIASENAAENVNPKIKALQVEIAAIQSPNPYYVLNTANTWKQGQTMPWIAFNTTSGIIGTTTNNSAAAGSVGELMQSTIASGSAVALTTATPANITSLSLTAGDWDVYAHLVFNPDSGVTTMTDLRASISTTSATLGAAQNGSQTIIPMFNQSTSITPVVKVGPVRISIASTTTVYMVAQSTFAVSTLSGYGNLRARRIR